MELGKCGNGKVLKALGICILAYFHIFTFAHCAKGAKSAAASGPSVGWVTACDDDQTSLEVNKRGKFTKPFVAAWKDDATDANGDGHNPA